MEINLTMKLLSYLGLVLGVSNQARFLREIKSDRAKNPKEYAIADNILSIYHSQGGLKQYTQAYKLVSLSRILYKKRPKRILELGTGSSSLVFAQYAKEMNAEMVYMDEDLEWINNTQRNVENITGLTNAEFMHSPRHVDTSQYPPRVRYASDINSCFDMIFVDGPALVIDSISRPDAICTDILEMERTLLPRTVVVDMRIPTVNALVKALAESHVPYVSDIITRTPRARFRYFSVFENTTVSKNT